MSRVITWRVFDSLGAPLPTATPTLLTYCDRLGVAQTPQPAISNLGNGLYSFVPNASQEQVGCGFLIDNGALASNRYVFDSFYGTTTVPFAALCFFNGDGTLFSGGGTPSVFAYVDPAGNARTPPSLVALAGNYFFALSASAADVAAGGIGYIVNGAVGSTPDSYSDSLFGAVIPAVVVTSGVAIFELLGVLETGAPRDVTVPVNVRKTLKVTIGQTLVLRLRVVQPDTSPVVGGTVDFAVAKRPGDGNKVIKKSATLATSTDITLSPSDTKQLLAGRYAWDIWYTDGSGNRAPVVPLSPFELEGAVTLPS